MKATESVAPVAVEVADRTGLVLPEIAKAPKVPTPVIEVKEPAVRSPFTMPP